MGGGKGGSSSTSTTTNNNYDPVYNAAMVDIASRQQAMSEDLWATYKQYFQDYEIAAAQANKELLPYITEASKMTLEEQMRDLQINQVVKDALREQQLQELEMSAPVAEKFYEMAAADIDEGAWMREARAGVLRELENQEAASLMEAARMGMDVNDPRLAALLKQSSLDKAKYAASAGWQASKDAENTEFARAAAGMTARGSATGLPGIMSTQGNGTQQFATPDMAGKAMAGMAGASNSMGVLAKQIQSSTQNSTTQNSNSGSFFGDALGFGLGIASMYSTMRLKRDITSLDAEKLQQIQPVSFRYVEGLDQDQRQLVGVIAEQVAPLFPEAVLFDDGGQPLAVDYAYLCVKLLGVLHNGGKQ